MMPPVVPGTASERSPRDDSLDQVSQPAGTGQPSLPLPGRRPGLELPQFVGLLLGNRKAVFGLAMLGTIVLLAVFAPLIARYPPGDFVALPSEPPSLDHWFGTTHEGQDIFSQVVWGARTSLAVGAAAAFVATFISAVLGMSAAYTGGWYDEIVNLIENIVLVIPALPLLIVVSSYLPFRNAYSMILIIAFITWAGEARVLRSQALSIRNRDFVLAAAATGLPAWRIVLGEIMPNMTSRIAAGFLGSFIGAIFFEAGLEFLGFGNTDNISWGITLFWAENNATLLTGEWWHFTFPGLAIALTATALIFINYGIDEISNPRLQRVRISRGMRRQWEEEDRVDAAR
jgi:peptide/nickel transport system permease protein